MVERAEGVNMLQNLHVKNLALIDETEVEFSEGLNILSGETGAGKSIIIGSINLALGEKVPKEMLKDNGEAAFVELIFTVQDEKLKKDLGDMDIEVEEDMLILSRKITKGKAIARINGEAVSASKLKMVASLLIDIHGQHEHQSLLYKKKHLEILDAYAKNELCDKKDQLVHCYKEYQSLCEKWDASSINQEDRVRELALLEYELKEIADANLELGEDDELENKYKRISNGKKIMEALGTALNAIGGEGESASELVGRGLREVSAVSSYDQTIQDIESQLSEIESLLHDCNHDISSYINHLEYDQAEFYEIEKRLDLINHLKSKYGQSIEKILAAHEEKEQRIMVLNDYDNFLNQLHKNIIEKEKELAFLSQEISDIRKRNAIALCDKISIALKNLNFLDVVFTMEFQKLDHYTANGIDDAEFMISTNPGEAVKALGKIASGGELSRIMLAIKTVMAKNDVIESLIFDEIDSGISGRTAQMVAEKMSELGRSHQIICITHLPQIAAMADTHFLIEKKVENHATHSEINKLSKEESIVELARMLGGVEITDAVLENAKEMKELAYIKK